MLELTLPMTGQHKFSHTYWLTYPMNVCARVFSYHDLQGGLYARDIPRNTWWLAIGERDKVNSTTEYHHQPRDDLSELRC